MHQKKHMPVTPLCQFDSKNVSLSRKFVQIGRRASTPIVGTVSDHHGPGHYLESLSLIRVDMSWLHPFGQFGSLVEVYAGY